MKSIRSTFLTSMGMFGQNALRLAGNLVLTRILFPEAFGIMALVQVCITGVGLFSDMGTRGAIIQNERGDDPAFLDTAWIFQILRGFVLWGVICLFAEPVAQFYEQPILADLLPLAGFSLVITGFRSTKMVTANRHLTLGRVTAFELIGQGLGIAVMIVLALILESVWALAWGMLVAPVFITALSHLALPGHTNRFRFERAAAATLFSFGKFIFIATSSTFLMTQADRAILGKFIPLDQLAFYNIAYGLASLPFVLKNRVARTIFLPLYVKRPPGASAVNRANFGRARFLVVGTLLSGAFFLALIGPAFVDLAYDARYVSAGPLITLIALALIPNILLGNYEVVMLAAGHSGRYALMLLSLASVRTGLLFLTIPTFGVTGAIYAMFLSSLLTYPLLVWFVRPYGSWMPKQDALFFTIAILGLIGVLWVTPQARTMLGLF